jgi:hypothetical protein
VNFCSAGRFSAEIYNWSNSMCPGKGATLRDRHVQLFPRTIMPQLPTEADTVRALWTISLGLSLGLLACRAGAEEVQWRPAGTPPASPAKPQNDTQPAATLGRPVAVRATSSIQPVSYSTADDPTRPIFRGQAPDVPKPMPQAGGKDKSSSDLPSPREMRETLAPSFPPPPTPVPGLPGMPGMSGVPVVPGDSGDFCAPCDCGGMTCGPDGCCGWSGCGNCCDNHLWWFDAEYLLWWIKSGPTPPLVTTGPASSFGVLGQPGTQILFGHALDYGGSSGGRFSTGLWFCDCQTLGLDASVFFLGASSVNFLAASDSMGSPVLSRPFTGAITGQQTVEQVAFPAEQAGSVSVHSASRLLGAETNLRWNPCCLQGTGCCGGTWRVGLLAGFRYLRLKEDLGITEDFTDLGAIVTRHQLTDSFDTRNNFYGGQLGAILEMKRGCWSLDLRAKVALGTTNQRVNISGSELDTSLNTGQQVSFNSGLLALPSNIGSFSRNVFSVVPEVGLNLGYQVCPNLRVFVGYNFIYWNNVARPGGQIDTVLNTTQQSGGTLVGPARPAFAFHNTDFAAHGVNFGLELRY